MPFDVIRPMSGAPPFAQSHKYLYRLRRRGLLRKWQNPLASVALHPIIAILGFLLSSSPLELFSHEPDDHICPLQIYLVFLHADRCSSPSHPIVALFPVLAALPSPSQCWRIGCSTAPGGLIDKQKRVDLALISTGAPGTRWL
ncbi:hypothetical protein N7466_011345 [Penicillium verhagenii]|uniref:uncharacterized protein n=1 Tax=Penicillium verhagenii TaxID=1562060 RepID=UPI002545BA83|nr:uncharacterized protein N7466_011345 [Penicillium verhagenii]KAJ5915412.1 hypothetical protein N7466_011345 [Penicillium verhagenii]